MGTQDEKHRAEPQNEFLSGFKLGAASKDKETQRSFVTQSRKIGTGLNHPKPTSGLQSRIGSNPYQLTQQMGKNTSTGQLSHDSLNKDTEPGLVQKLKSKLFKHESEPGSGRQKIMMALIPILFIIMIFTFRQVLSKPPQKTSGAEGTGKSVVDAKSNSSSEIKWTIPDPIPAKMRDPIKVDNTALQNTVQGTAANTTNTNIEDGSMDVRGILYSDKPSVVIGNQIVHLNQKVNGATVVEIHKDYIVFEKNGKQWSQRVAEETLKQNRGNDPNKDKKADMSK